MGLFKIGTGSPEPTIVIPVTINGTNISMELDTTVTVAMILEETWNEKFPAAPLENSQLKLKTCIGEHLQTKRQAFVDVSYNGQNVKLPLQVIDLVWKELDEETENRLGTIKKVTTDLETVLNQHKEVFKDDLGTLRGC